MRRWLLILVAAVASLPSGGCRRSVDSGQPAPVASAVPRADRLAVGTAILVRSPGTMYWDPGTVGALAGDEITVERPNEPSTRAVATDCYLRASAEAAQKPSVGDFVLAPCLPTRSARWCPAKVDAIANDGVHLSYVIGGRSQVVPARDMVLTSASLGPSFDEELRQVQRARADAQYLAEADAQGGPHRPAGWRPRVGTDVLAPLEWIGLLACRHPKYFTAHVEKVDGEQVTVSRRTSASSSTLRSDAVAPVPNAKLAGKVEPPSYVLVRPSDGTHWKPALAVAWDATGVEVSGVGGRRTVAAGDFVVLDDIGSRSADRGTCSGALPKPTPAAGEP